MNLGTATASSATYGTHTITAAAGTAANYEVVFVDGTLTVSKAAALTVTANNKTKVYGAVEPTLDYTPSGTLYYTDAYDVINGVSLSTATGTAATYGTHSITASGGTASNYNVTHQAGTLTVTKAMITVINAVAQPKIYDSYTTAVVTGAQIYGVFYSGTVILGNTSTGTFSQSAVGTNIAVSSAMTISGTDAFNYNITQPAGLNANITLKSLSITADNKSKLYNGLIYSPFTVTYVGLVGAETSANLGGSLAFSGNAVTATINGSYTIVPSGQTSSNYAITYSNGTLTIYRAPAVNVINIQNNGYGSLREAIDNAAENGVITFATGLNALTIYLTTGTLIIDKNVIFDNSNHLFGISIGGSGDNITIMPGKSLTLTTSSRFTILGNIKNNGGKGNAGLILNSGSSFIHNTVDLPATVKRLLNPGWHLFGSPFKQNTGSSLAGLIPLGGNVQMLPYTNGVNWGSAVSSPYYYFQPTVGYAVKPSIAVTALLTGNLYYSPIDYTIPLIYNGTAATQSWNLVANPYTSYLNWNLLGKTNLNTSLYLWDNALYPLYTPVTNAAYFRTYNSCNNVGVPAGTTPYIAPLQGFFVRAVYTGPKLSFLPSARLHSTLGFYKGYTNTEILLRLKTETDRGVDELVICKNPNSALDFEQFDSEKLFGGMPVEFYSLSASGEKLVINSINTTQTVIPLGINGNAGAKGKITAFALETAEQLYLEDRLKAKFISLSENTTYDFDFSTDQITGRFFIHFGAVNPSAMTSDVKVFVVDHQLNVIAQTGEELQQIEVFTPTGARVFKTDASKTNVFATELQLAPAIYLVRVKTTLGTQNVKIRL